MSISEYYQKKRYSKKSQGERLPIYRKRIQVYLKAINQFQSDHKKRRIKILDVGCGDGGLGKELQKHINVDVYGVDISKTGVRLANKIGIPSKVGNVEKKVPYPSSYFDVIIANEIIEHLYDTDKFLEELYRVLNKKGLLIIGTPNISFWFNRMLFLFGIYPLYQEVSIKIRNLGMGFLARYVDNQPVGHVRVFNLPALKGMLRYYKFTIMNVYGNPVAFESSQKILTHIYRLFDEIFSVIPNLASDLVVIAMKHEKHNN